MVVSYLKPEIQVPARYCFYLLGSQLIALLQVCSVCAAAIQMLRAAKHLSDP